MGQIPCSTERISCYKWTSLIYIMSPVKLLVLYVVRNLVAPLEYVVLGNAVLLVHIVNSVRHKSVVCIDPSICKCLIDCITWSAYFAPVGWRSIYDQHVCLAVCLFVCLFFCLSVHSIAEQEASCQLTFCQMLHSCMKNHIWKACSREWMTFKVTQGHRNRLYSTGHISLPISDLQ